MATEHWDYREARSSLDAPAKRLLSRVTVFLSILTFILGATAWVAISDPHGLLGAPPITQSDVRRLEPLYGATYTPWYSLDWSPDGRWIAVGGGDSAYEALIVDAQSGAFVSELTPSRFQIADEGAPLPGGVVAVRWSPSGKHLAVGASTGFGGPGWVHLYSWTGERESSWPVFIHYLEGIAWSPDETRLVTAGGGEFAVWDVEAYTRVLHVSNASVGPVDWSPDGDLLAFGIYVGVQIYDATSGVRMLVIPTGGGASWSHDGLRLATASENGCATMYHRDGTLLWRSNVGFYCGTAYRALRPAWNPSDTILALPAPPGIALFDASTGGLLRILDFPVDRYGPSLYQGGRGDFAVVWSPTGEALASTGPLSAPSLRMWGVRRSGMALLSATFEGVVILGLPLVLYPGPRFWFPINSRQRIALLSSGLGGLLFLMAFVLAILQALQLDLVHRTYDALAMPSLRWLLATAVFSTAVGAFGAAAFVWAFKGAFRIPNSRGRAIQVLRKTAGTLGPVLLPIVWMTAAGLFAESLILATGTNLTLGLRGGILGATGGAGMLVSSRYAPLLGTTPRRLTGALLGGTLVSFFAALLVVVLLAFGATSLTVSLYGPEIFLNAPSVLFGFALAPFVLGLIALAFTAAIAPLALAAPKWITAFYSRLTPGKVVDLEARKKVLAYLAAHPGAHFREILRGLGMGSGALHYHLYVLERAGLIVPQREGMYRRYFRAAESGTAP